MGELSRVKANLTHLSVGIITADDRVIGVFYIWSVISPVDKIGSFMIDSKLIRVGFAIVISESLIHIDKDKVSN